MQRDPVSSSNIAEVGYDAPSMTLEIAFSDGGVYQYFEVPETVYQEFMRASSKGKFFHANIKDSYRYQKA